MVEDNTYPWDRDEEDDADTWDRDDEPYLSDDDDWLDEPTPEEEDD